MPLFYGINNIFYYMRDMLKILFYFGKKEPDEKQSFVYN